MNYPVIPDGWTGCLMAAFSTSGGTMISDVDYYCGWLVFIVLMVLGFIAGGNV